MHKSVKSFESYYSKNYIIVEIVFSIRSKVILHRKSEFDVVNPI